MTSASQSTPSGMGKTALGVAAVRAQESQRPDSLFDDPYAQAFLDAAPGAFAAEHATAQDRRPMATLGAAFAFHGVLRTRFFDDHLLTATAAGCAQVVLLAAGLDTRAFRLPWPAGVHVFEIDLPDVLTFKEGVLSEQAARPQCTRTIVPADLRANWAERLTQAGFRVATPTMWLAEGLLLYLSAEDATALLDEVGGLSAPGSHLAFEHGGIADNSLLSHARAMPTMDQYTELWKGGLGPDTPEWLTRHGWRVRTHDQATFAASYNRAVPDSSSGEFITAERA
jgi:methyltransferase (TIGR00027 family)